MNDCDALIDLVRAAWSDVPAPGAEEVKYLSWGWGEAAARAFSGVAPVDVDRTSAGFLVCTPLDDLPPAAAAAYLGTYLLALLESLAFQRRTGIFHDVLTRAHTLHCIGSQDFIESVVGPHLDARRKAALAAVAGCVLQCRAELGLSEAQTAPIARLAAGLGQAAPKGAP